MHIHIHHSASKTKCKTKENFFDDFFKVTGQWHHYRVLKYKKRKKERKKSMNSKRFPPKMAWQAYNCKGICKCMKLAWTAQKIKTVLRWCRLSYKENSQKAALPLCTFVKGCEVLFWCHCNKIWPCLVLQLTASTGSFFLPSCARTKLQGLPGFHGVFPSSKECSEFLGDEVVWYANFCH